MIRQDQAILWDVGGTLVDFACTLPGSVRRRLDAFAIDHSQLSDARIEQTYTEFIRTEQQWRTPEQERAAECAWFTELLGNAQFDHATIHNIAAQSPRYFAMYRPVPGMVQLLDDLTRQNVPMAIVSNWPPSLPHFLDHHSLTPYFHPIVHSSQDGIHKPDPRIFQRALNILQIPAERAIFIGDNPDLDISPARALGMRTIHFDPRRKYLSQDAHDTRTLRRLLNAILSLP